MRSAERGKACGDEMGMKLAHLFDIFAFVHEVVEHLYTGSVFEPCL